MPFSVFFISIFRKLSLRVLTSLLQTPFFQHLSTLTVKEIKWTTAIPIYTLQETTYWSFKIKLSQDCKITKQNPFWGDPLWNIRGEGSIYKLYWLWRSAGTSCCWDISGSEGGEQSTVLHFQKTMPSLHDQEQPAWRPLTTQPNSCDDSLPEWSISVSWGDREVPHLLFWNMIPENKIIAFEAWWSLFCNLLDFHKVTGDDHFFPYLSVKDLT